jgi:hypothetical protein
MQQLPGVDGSTGRVYLRSMVQQLAERQHTQALGVWGGKKGGGGGKKP